MALQMHYRARKIGAALLLVAGVVWTAGCERWGEKHSPNDQMSSDRVECPQHWGTAPLYPDAAITNREKGKAQGDRLPNQIVAGPKGLELKSASGEVSPAGPITNIPEFHDCQRFVSRDGTKFDSLFAIFASFRLDSVTRALGWREDVVWSSSNPKVATVDAKGRITAVSAGTTTIAAVAKDSASVKPVVRDSATRKATANNERSQTDSGSLTITVSRAPTAETTVSVPSSEPFAMGIGQAIQAVPQIGRVTDNSLAAAAIYSYGPGYTDLGIGPNFNCLYLYFDNTAALRAKMVHVDSLPKYANACLDAVDPKTAPGQILSITKSPTGPADDFPAVARWDWDPKTKRYYVGIRCKDAWCEVGRNGTSTSRSYLEGVPVTPGDRVIRVKGWYDEQNLAWRGTPTEPLTPSGITGTVIPVANLATLKGQAAFKSFVTVGYVALDTSAAVPGSVAHFKRKLNLNPVSVVSETAPFWDPTRLNKLELCYGTQSDCKVSWTSEPQDFRCASRNLVGWPLRRWWQRITAAGETVPQFRCVTRRDHSDYAEGIPATARWRWILGDDTIWTECTQGCCETETGRS